MSAICLSTVRMRGSFRWGWAASSTALYGDALLFSFCSYLYARSSRDAQGSGTNLGVFGPWYGPRASGHSGSLLPTQAALSSRGCGAEPGIQTRERAKDWRRLGFWIPGSPAAPRNDGTDRGTWVRGVERRWRLRTCSGMPAVWLRPMRVLTAQDPEGPPALTALSGRLTDRSAAKLRPRPALLLHRTLG